MYASIRDRLPSAAAAIALQGGLLALLVFSFEATRQVKSEKETILILPPLVRPLLRRPVIIDARRPARKSSQAQPAEDTALPAPAAPPVTALPAAPDNAPSPGGKSGECGVAAIACPPARAAAPDEIPLHPKSDVKNEPLWQSEMERRNTPPRVPCVSLTNNVVGMGGFARQDSGARMDITCALKALRDGAGVLPPVRGAVIPDPAAGHASDEAVAKALQAAHARQRVLSPQLAPPAGASP